jgi:putative Holliday junction resolvase
MPICNLADLPAKLEKNQTILGIDYGSKHIGLAIADPGLQLATPLGTIERGKFAGVLKELQGYMASRNVGALVLGLPLALDGKDTPASQSVRTFAVNLEKAIAPQMAFCDERFSSAVIQRQLTEVADLSRAKRAAAVDKLAAAYILQGALDYWRHHHKGPS